MTRFSLSFAFLLCVLPGALPGVLSAQCVGQNLVAALSDPDRAELMARRDAVPFAMGNFWTATKDGQSITLMGTYHLSDNRHDAVIAAASALLDQGKLLLVEAGPEEEAALKAHLSQNPQAMVITKGPSLPEQLSPDEWAMLKPAMEARGVPGIMAAKMQPWMIAVTLGLPVCALADVSRGNGMDRRLMAAAKTRAIPVQSLETFDTVLRVFDQMTASEQLDMIRSALAIEHMGDDMIVTMSDLYFQGDARMIWEFSKHLALALPGYTPERVEAEFAVTEAGLVNGRNQAWIPRIEAAAANGPVIAAFGALHLSGEQGVLNLLAQRGWALTPLDLAGQP